MSSSFFLLLLIPTASIWLSFLFVLLLLLSSALISGSEVAFFSLSHHDFARLRDDNDKPSQRILKLHDKPRTLLATILISNNFINIAIVLVSDYLLQQLLPESLFLGWAQSLKQTFAFLTTSVDALSRTMVFSINVIGVTFLLVLFGEVAPKIYAKLNNIQLAKFMAAPLDLLMKLFLPFSTLLVKGTNIIEKRLEKRSQPGSMTSRADIDEAIELTVSHELNARQEIDILKGIVKFGDVTVRQIMQARVDVKAIEFDTPYHDLLKMIKEWGYSRIPIYKEDFDHITGILYVKDLVGYLDLNNQFEWQSLIRTNLLFVPESKKINDMLREFQQKRMHLAFVVDEYGGTAGVVTLEDIMEEVIGEIRDEFDDEEEVEYTKLDEFKYQFEGKTFLNDCCRVMKLPTDTFDPARKDADSLAGLVLYLAGQFPKKGAEYNWDRFRFKVINVDKRRISQILITILEP
ncbi:MAG: gliding motility-associated protein GldE [Saprospiraceae bacterium]|nr:gliding motility-associated protein GldE [Saprospiraceae bacterium]